MKTNYILVQESSIDAVVAAAIYRAENGGEVITSIPNMTYVHGLIVIGHVGRYIHEEVDGVYHDRMDGYIVQDVGDQRTVRHLDGIVKLVEHHNLNEKEVERFYSLLDRIEGCDRSVSLEDQALIYHIHRQAFESLYNDGGFVFSMQYRPEMKDEYISFLKRVKKDMGKKIFKKHVSVKKTFLGFPLWHLYSAPMHYLNIDLWLTPWVTKLASLTMNAIAVFDYNSQGEVIYVLKAFNKEGKIAINAVLQHAGKA